MSELEQILLQRLEVAESKLMDLGWLRSSKGHYVAATYWCCNADLGEHEPTCTNFVAGAPAEKTATTGDYCRDCREPVTGSVHVELVSGEKMCFRCFKRMG